MSKQPQACSPGSNPRRRIPQDQPPPLSLSGTPGAGTDRGIQLGAFEKVCSYTE